MIHSYANGKRKSFVFFMLVKLVYYMYVTLFITDAMRTHNNHNILLTAIQTGICLHKHLF